MRRTHRQAGHPGDTDHHAATSSATARSGTASREKRQNFAVQAAAINPKDAEVLTELVRIMEWAEHRAEAEAIRRAPAWVIRWRGRAATPAVTAGGKWPRRS